MSTYKQKYEGLLGSLPEPNEEFEVSIICPFHEDQKRSASINMKTGLFHCFACGQSHNYLQFKKAYSEENGDPDLDDPPEPVAEVIKAIHDEVVKDLHLDLMVNQDILDRLAQDRGLSKQIIKDMQIGWHSKTKRIAIPIRDENGVCVNIRLYSFTESGSQKMLSWRAGFGRARLWPLNSLDLSKKYVILTEGEMDCLTVLSQGLNAVTSTGGAKTWKTEWSEKFKGLKVYITYDCDTTGEEGAKKAAASISAFAEEVRIVKLDLSKPGEDVTDFFVHYGYTVEDLKRLIKDSPKYRKPLKQEDFAESGDVNWTTLGQSLQPFHRGKDLMVPVIVSARRDERMHYPAETMFNCNQDAGNICKKCRLVGIGEATVRIKPNDHGLTDFVGVSQAQQAAIIKGRAGIPQTCKQVETSITEAGTIEEILVTPEIDSSGNDTDSMHLIQRAFYVGLGLEYNASYVMRTRPTPFHKSSKIVHHVIDAVPAHDSIESFEMIPEIYERLRIFQAEPGKELSKLGEIERNLQDHVTRIWDRLDLHVGMDLVWHSVLEFEFDGKVIRRGWLEACVVGDTRTGKSEIASQLQRHYGLGEVVSGENTSYAGLVGGAIKYDDSWFVKWGRIPLNDRRLVVIDEVTGMSTDDIALMSGIRETGIADITKIETQKAHARTRALWIGNVRFPKRDLGDYDYGCMALEDLIGMPEDIARFDYAMSAGRDEVNSATVNSAHPIEGHLLYDSDSCGLLILWAWSRGRDQIHFQRDAVEACWQHAIEMGNTYTSALPLVMPENQRIKLARVAAAVAARLFSTTDGETLIVTANHVEVARKLLDKFYSKPSFGYLQLSRQRIHFAERRKGGINKVNKFLSTRPVLADFLSRTKMINAKKISDQIGVGDEESKEILRFLTSTMMVEDKGGHGYQVTPDLKSIADKVIPTQYSLEER